MECQCPLRPGEFLLSELKDKLENALNEGRILMLGGQVLIGAGFRLIFAEEFEKLTSYTQFIVVASVWLMLLSLGILLVAPAYHFLVENGENTRRFHELITWILEWTLLPFALGLGVSVFVVGEKAMDASAGATAGALIFIFAISIWYVLSALKVKRRPIAVPKEGPTQLKDKIKEALIEARMILPGAQALLGFQVANTFTIAFDKLPRSSQWAHMGSLICIAVSTAFLMAPAAYHRIAEHGEDSEEFYGVSGRMLLTALFWLGLGIAAELSVVLTRIGQSARFSMGVSILTLIFFYGLWFGYSALKRQQNLRARLAG